MKVECSARANPAPSSYTWTRGRGDTWREEGRWLVLKNVSHADSGEYTCQPAAGAAARVLVHVLQRETEVQAVLGEGESNPYFKKHLLSVSLSFVPSVASVLVHVLQRD